MSNQNQDLPKPLTIEEEYEYTRLFMEFAVTGGNINPIMYDRLTDLSARKAAYKKLVIHQMQWN